MRLSDIKDLNEANVFLNEKFAGRIKRAPNGSTFEYENDFLEYAQSNNISGISFSLSTKNKIYNTQGTNLHPFFANLLPEGRRLQALGQVAKTSLDDLFTLVIAGGSNCIGDVTVATLKEIPSLSSESKNENISLEDVLFWDLFEKSIFGETYEDKARDLNIAGVYPKISAGMISFPLRLLRSKSEYILKLEPKEYSCLVANEFFFMNLARECGLEVPEVKVVFDKNSNPGLLVERFDRSFDKKNKQVKKIHQEDVCQLLNVYPSEKYRISMREVAEVLEEVTSTPIIEISKLIRLYLFSYFIGNGDLHAKNISILKYYDTDRTILSPAYDLLSTYPYGDKEMALHLEGKKSNIRYKDTINFAKRHGIEDRVIDSMVLTLKTEILDAIMSMHNIGLDNKKTKALVQVVADRVRGF